MAERLGEWRTFGERLVYDNRWVQVGLVDVLAPNQQRFDYHVVHFGSVAIALIVDDQERALMMWRHRFPVDRWGYELLGGLVEPGESAAEAAAREAREESGWQPTGEPEHVVSFDPIPGWATGQVDVFLWRTAEKVGEPLADTDEIGRLEWVPLTRVTELIQRRELLGAGAIIPLLYYLLQRDSTKH